MAAIRIAFPVSTAVWIARYSGQQYAVEPQVIRSCALHNQNILYYHFQEGGERLPYWQVFATEQEANSFANAPSEPGVHPSAWWGVPPVWDYRMPGEEDWNALVDEIMDGSSQ